MYISPFASSGKTNTPREYTNRARDEINKTLRLNSTTTSRHGPSPLQRVMSTASDSSLTRTMSNESVDTITTEKRKSGFFGRLRLRKDKQEDQTSTLQQLQQHLHESSEQLESIDTDSVMSYDSASTTSLSESDSLLGDDRMDVDMQQIYTVPSIASTTMSMATESTASDSLFSAANTLGTTFTNVSSQADYQPYQKGVALTLQEAIPTSFADMYSPELMADPKMLCDGRPLFTKRALQDWELNDIRSLLIVESLKPEWGNQLPIIYSPPGFKFEFLPLDADDSTVVRTLVQSDIYREAKLDTAFREQTAKYTLSAARMRHEQIVRASGMPTSTHAPRCLSKPEWRNVIENYLLNLAVEAQCRYDFKKVCHEAKKWKRQQQAQNLGLPSPKFVNPNKGSLLKKAIMNDVSQSSPQQAVVKLTKEEKAQLWTEVQEKVYRRIGLDWTPDKITA